MSGWSLRQFYEAMIRAVAAGDEDALDGHMHDAFGDLAFVIEETVVEGDKIAARVTWPGTRRGDLVGVSGTGAPVATQSAQALEF